MKMGRTWALLVALFTSLSFVESAFARGEEPSDRSRQAAPRGAGAGKVEGSWRLTISPLAPPGVPAPPPFHTYLTIAPQGVLLGSDRTKPFASLQQGTWVRAGNKRIDGTMVQDQFDASGNFVGVFTVRLKIQLSGPDSVDGIANVLFRNPAGGVVLEGCARFVGERVAVEDFTSCEGLALP
jgi:hypothetical protein